MKKIILLAVFTTLFHVVASACDACILSLGINPSKDKSAISLVYQSVSNNGSLVSPYRHGGAHEGPDFEERYISSHLRMQYFFKYNFNVVVDLPYEANSYLSDGKVTDSQSGLGDPIVLVNYIFLNTIRKVKNKLTVGLGGEVPIGIYNETYDPELSPGSGSWAGIGFVEDLLIWKNWGLLNRLTYKANGVNKGNYQLGNAFNYQSSLLYKIKVSKLNIIPHAGIYLENQAMSEFNSMKQANTGGTLTYVKSGINFSLNHKWVIQTDCRFSVSGQAGGWETINGRLFNISFNYLFD